MMGRQSGDQASLFYEFRLDDGVPKDHLLRRINAFMTVALADVHEQFDPYYSEIGRPSVDPELMIRMLIVGYCYGLRSERKLTQEVELHLAYRWFCRLDLDDKVPHHSTFLENRLHRFRESDVFRHIFERVVAACMGAGLVKGEGRASWRRTRAAITGRRPTSSIGQRSSVRSELWLSIWRHSKLRPQLLVMLQMMVQTAGPKAHAAPLRASAAQGDLTVGPAIGMDGQGQQVRAVRLWAELPHRHRERRDRRC
jgi:transposase